MSDEHTSPQPEPAAIGPILRKAREEKGLTFQQVEQRTKIRARYLQAFEREGFDVLPAVYVLGSLKTYADFLGLNGAALSGQLKARLGQPSEPDIVAQLAALEGPGDEDDEYEAAPVAAVGFDRLFLGMGVLLISILAVMTLVTSFAQGDESPISQLDEPSTPETPSEIALASNVVNPQPRPTDGPTPAKGDKGDKPKAGKAGGGEDNEEASKNGKDQDDSRESALFGDAKFVPMTPPSPTAEASATTAPSATTAASASASATARPAEPSAPASAAASSPVPYEGGRSTVPAPPAAATEGPANATPRSGGGQGPAPAGSNGQKPISAQIDSRVDDALEAAGLGG